MTGNGTDVNDMDRILSRWTTAEREATFMSSIADTSGAPPLSSPAGPLPSAAQGARS